MPLSPIQTAHSKYMLTASDVLNGFAAVPFTWPEPFADTDYDVAFSVQDLTTPLPSLNFGVGDFHEKSITGVTVSVALLAAIPLVQGQVDLVNSTSTLTPISLTAALTSMYQVTFYYGPADNSGAGTWTPLVSWQDPTGNSLNSSTYLGPATAGSIQNFQSFSTPFYVKGGTPIVVTGSYSGAAFPMNVSIRVVQMPSNAVIPVPGSVIEVEALAIHY